MDLDEAAVGRLLRVDDVIAAMERALADFHLYASRRRRVPVPRYRWEGPPSRRP